jgi:phosphoglycolate phosphatase-like HAD superfamily hydrolase
MPSKKNEFIHIFDCDGVILDSNQSKVSAVEETLKSFNAPKEFIDWAKVEFRNNFGRTRLNHFEVFSDYKGIEGYIFNKENIEKALKTYSLFVKKIYKKCDVIESTYNFIFSLPSSDSIYVVSASDQDELRDILPKKLCKIRKENIYGGPMGKIENINYIKSSLGVKDYFFYGDSVQDARAALATEIEFIGLTNFSAAPHLLTNFCENNSLKYYESIDSLLISK